MIRLTKIKLKGLRMNKKVTVGQVQRRDSQIGQLLYYLTALQLGRIQLFLSPSERPNTHGEPHEVLGLFMEQGKGCVYLYPGNTDQYLTAIMWILSNHMQ